jgi:4-hydroxybenzoate polyprenyltransferase
MRPVRPLLPRILAAVEVARLPIAFGVVANVWLMVLLARVEASAGSVAGSVAGSGDQMQGGSAQLVAALPLWLALGASLAFAVGFMAFGAALNDALDAKRDRAFAPERPIPSGSIAARRAFHIAFAALVVGVLGALPFGIAALAGALVLAAIVLGYDAFAKHIPAFGIVLAGLATAVSMLALTPDSPSLLPVWLAMSQTMGVGALAYLLGEKRPKLSRRAVALGAAGWVFWSAALFALALERNGGLDGGALLPAFFEPRLLVLPVLAVVVCALFGLWKLRGVRGPRAAEKLLRYGSLWKAIVAAGWLAAAGLATEAAAIAGIAIAITAVLSIARELAPQASAPASWRS